MSDFDLEFRNVSKYYGGVRALDEVTFQVRSGECLSLLGPSGCGKTTSLRMIAGFEQPTSGEIYLEHKPIGGTPPYRRNVNTVFQHYALFPHKSVFDNIAFGLRMKRLPSAEVARSVQSMLALVELPDIGARFPDQLSGGQQQRVALARALINEPTVLLLDEPLGALDLKVRRRMQQELKRIHREVGVTFIYVTHDQEEALTMSDRIAVMNHGRIEQLDSPAAIYERPANGFVASFIGLMNALPGVVEGHENGAVVVRTAEGTLLRGAPEGPGATPGSQVEVIVRPEKIQMSREAAPEADNCVPGQVVDVVYQGASTEYRVALSASRTVRVMAQNLLETWDAARIPVGSAVFLHWPTKAALVLAATNAARSVPLGEDLD